MREILAFGCDQRRAQDLGTGLIAVNAQHTLVPTHDKRPPKRAETHLTDSDGVRIQICPRCTYGRHVGIAKGNREWRLTLESNDVILSGVVARDATLVRGLMKNGPVAGDVASDKNGQIADLHRMGIECRDALCVEFNAEFVDADSF